MSSSLLGDPGPRAVPTEAEREIERDTLLIFSDLYFRFRYEPKLPSWRSRLQLDLLDAVLQCEQEIVSLRESVTNAHQEMADSPAEKLLLRRRALLKRISDSIAWEALAGHRAILRALGESNEPGFMYGKAGLEFEKAILHLWEKDPHAADRRGIWGILHDITTCLRIGDFTFVHDGRVVTIEMKSGKKDRRARRQQRRFNALQEFLTKGFSTDFPRKGQRRVLAKVPVSEQFYWDEMEAVLRRLQIEPIVVTRVSPATTLIGLNLVERKEDDALQQALSLVGRPLSKGKRKATVTFGSLDQTLDPEFLRESRDLMPPTSLPLHPQLFLNLVFNVFRLIVLIDVDQLAQMATQAGLKLATPALDPDTWRWVWERKGARIIGGQGMAKRLIYEGLREESLFETIRYLADNPQGPYRGELIPMQLDVSGP